MDGMQAHGAKVEQRKLRADLQKNDPGLVGMFDAYVESGGDARSFRSLVNNQTTRGALTQLASLEGDASKLLDANVATKDIWGHDISGSDGQFVVDANGNRIAVNEGETFGLKTLNALSDLQSGLSQLENTVPLDKMFLAVQVATLGPAGFALDYVKGMAVDSFAGKYIAAGVERLSTVFNAGAHGTDSETASYLLNNRAAFEDLQNAAFDGTSFDETRLANAENLLRLNADFGRTQSGATLLSAGILMGTMALKGPRTESSTTPDVRTGAGYGVNDPPVRIQGEWTEADLKQALLGHPPRGLGSPQLHHADQMPGSGIHEIVPRDHKAGNLALHPNGNRGQGVTNEMRKADRELHWWYRAREQGADQVLPDWIYD